MGGLGVVFLVFPKLESGVARAPATSMLNQDVADLRIFDLVTGNSAQDGTHPRNRIRAHQVADPHSA